MAGGNQHAAVSEHHPSAKIQGGWMQHTRRQACALLGAALAAPALSRTDAAQTYPARPVRIIVPFGPGGVADILARLIGRRLSERLGQPFIIENRLGASGMIGTESVVRAPADGYTLLLMGTGAAINPTLYDKPFLRRIDPVASLVRAPAIMEVNPAVPAATVAEFVAYAKAHPGKISYASGGSGTTLHMHGELFKMMTGIDMVHVPYRSGEPAALPDLISGQVQLMFGDLLSSVPHIKAGELRALAVTTPMRWEGFPDVPPVSDLVPGFEATNWQGVWAPENTDGEIIGALNREINAALGDAAIKSRVVDLGAEVLIGSPTQFGHLIAADTEKWAKVIRTANIKPD
jgi:tripartite-type tricarboxylate transporter receptor subunit TctC